MVAGKLRGFPNQINAENKERTENEKEIDSGVRWFAWRVWGLDLEVPGTASKIKTEAAMIMEIWMITNGITDSPEFNKGKFSGMLRR